MPVVLCPSCSAPLNVPDRHAGRILNCPKCRVAFTAGTPSLSSEAVSAQPAPAPVPRAESRPPHDVSKQQGPGKLLLLIGIPTAMAALLCCGGAGAVGMIVYNTHKAVQEERRKAEAARRIQEQKTANANKLTQIVLAMHTYHDVYKRFPAQAIYSKDNKTPLLSWRVAILPSIGEVALYNQFRLDEPWDSTHNKALLSRMPTVYAAPAGLEASDPTTTYFQVFTGPNTVFDDPRGKPLTSITDGTSNTFLVVDAGTAVLWTKPEDLPFVPTAPLPKLGGRFNDGFHAALADGRVAFIRNGSPCATEVNLRAMITANGGEIIIPPD
jgi:hypothetical protein